MSSPNPNYTAGVMADDPMDDQQFDMQQLCEGRSAFQLAAQNDTPAPTPASTTATQSTPSTAFWNAVVSLIIPSTGQEMTAPARELWTNVPELRPVIKGLWAAQQAGAQGAVGGGDAVYGASDGASGMGYQYQSPVDQQQMQAYPGAQGMASPQNGYATPNNGYQSPYPTPGLSSPASYVPQHLNKKRKRPDAAPVGNFTLPPYNRTPDLDGPSAAREYLSRFDPNDAFFLQIFNDDVGMVQANIHIYAAEAYAALLHPYAPNPPELDDRESRYHGQQEAALMWLEKNLLTPVQIKTAQACAILLVDAAIGIHTNGVSAARMAKHQQADHRGLALDNSFRISPELTCSQRVRAMINAVKANKLVAKDVLEQKSLVRFAECPDAYVTRKFQYLRSNKTRQDKVEERAQADEAMGVSGRRKRARRTAEAGVYGGGDRGVEDDPDGEFRP